ncbi:MAG: hypothetical protein JWR22_3957 [Herminiimonas sp.]|nr:hypothetical protein [Herminiimonas sp.]
MVAESITTRCRRIVESTLNRHHRQTIRRPPGTSFVITGTPSDGFSDSTCGVLKLDSTRREIPQRHRQYAVLVA